MNLNLTMFGQLIAFTMFVLFCMKYVWPPLTTMMRERQKAIADGLEKAAAAEAQLEQANDAAEKELEEAKQQAAELIAQARNRANQIVEEAKSQATEEADRIRENAQADIDLEISQAREALRERVGELAIEGAQRILESTVDRGAHDEMLKKLSAEL